LARLVISPQHRGRAAGAVLIRELCTRGCKALGVSECSLFVLQANTPAVRLYSHLGFRVAAYPEAMPPIENCDYMIAAANTIETEWE
jgi:ribosomal protein S18 acetylase RimI-like enzyme